MPIAKLLAHVYSFHTRLVRLGNRKDIYTAYALAMIRWKVVLVDGLQKTGCKLTKALLSVVASQREGEAVDTNRFISVLSSLTPLGRSGKGGEMETRKVYEDVFERPYMEDTKAFHTQSARLLLSQGTMVEYVQIAEQWLLVEEKIASVFPSEETRICLMKTLEGVLLTQHSKALYEYASKSISEARHTEIKHLYTLYAHVPNGLKELRGVFGEDFLVSGEAV